MKSDKDSKYYNKASVNIITGGENVYIGIEQENEQFREIYINGEKSRYYASTLGRIYSIVSTRILIPSLDKNGYLQIALRATGGDPKWFRVHRVILGCFYKGEPETVESVNHKNGDKGDNRIENLEYCSTVDNNRHFAKELKYEQKQSGQDIINKLQKEHLKVNIEYSRQQKSNPRGRSEISEKEFAEITELVERHYPNKEICIEYNIKISVIKNIKRMTSYGRKPKDVPDDVIRLICEEMKQGDYDAKELSLKYDVRQSVISSIRYRWKRFEHIWKEYFKE